eukprot:COSAG06_NODE_31423_length_521_cov_48.424171_1_plen_88_part_00
MSVRRKLSLTAQVAAAYAPRVEEGLPSNISVGQTQRRGARTELRQFHVAGLSRWAQAPTAAMCTWRAQPAGRRRSLMGPRDEGSWKA